MTFKVDGPLTNDHTNMFIEREAVGQGLKHLQEMEYLMIIAPQQQGITSLISHFSFHPSLYNHQFLYISFNWLTRRNEQIWYQTVGTRILQQLHKWPETQTLKIPEDSVGWGTFLADLSLLGTKKNKKLVIVIDELGLVSFDWTDDFFGQLRAIYEQRPFQQEFNRITFIFAGTYDPHKLIKDTAISPFNVAKRIHLQDFTEEQTQQLVSKGSWDASQLPLLAQRIYYWTDGHPYLTQLICTRLDSKPTTLNADEVINQLLGENIEHLSRIRKKLDDSLRLAAYVNGIVTGNRLRFNRQNPIQSQLELLGVIKEGADGYCVIRNRLYQLILYGSVIEAETIREFNAPDIEETHHELLVTIFSLISYHFDFQELKTLCFMLPGVDYDDLPGQGKASKVRELVLLMERHGRLHELIQECQEQRSHVQWPDITSYT